MKTRTSPSSLTIYGAKKVFSHIDLAFKNLKINDEVASPETFNAYELLVDANFLQTFLSLNSSPKVLGVSEEMVVKFCINHLDDLKDVGRKTFFYLGDGIVAKVNCHADGLHINRYDLHSPIIWWGKNKRFFVVPGV